MDTSAKHHCITDPAAVTWLDELQRANATLRAQLAEAHAELAAAREVVGTVQAYFNKRGAAHAYEFGNADIADMAEALAEYGAVEQASLAATRGR